MKCSDSSFTTHWLHGWPRSKQKRKSLWYHSGITRCLLQLILITFAFVLFVFLLFFLNSCMQSFNFFDYPYNSSDHLWLWPFLYLWITCMHAWYFIARYIHGLGREKLFSYIMYDNHPQQNSCWCATCSIMWRTFFIRGPICIVWSHF